jgi:hypothetical protein
MQDPERDSAHIVMGSVKSKWRRSAKLCLAVLRNGDRMLYEGRGETGHSEDALCPRVRLAVFGLWQTPPW